MPSSLEVSERVIVSGDLPPSPVPEFTVGQPVFHPGHGYGEVNAVESDLVSFRERKDPTLVHTSPAGELITKEQAESALQATWNACGFQEYRRRMGKWCSITKNLCRHGQWDDVCARHGLNLRTANDWIRDFENEMTWRAQEEAFAAFRKAAESADLKSIYQTEISGTSVYAVTGTPQINERTPDPDNDKREDNKKKEREKREGIKPTPHKTMLSIQRRKLDPIKLALYYTIRDARKDQVHEIMKRKIDEGMDEVLALDPQTADPAIMRFLEVRSLLRNQGFKETEIGRITLDPALDFDELVRSAFDQLKANAQGGL